ncbi:MAG: hypothetical protein MUC41_00715 [Syntrophobacteraceae bacterium]|jgi:hypothetical protein|nr:hypothetical protein [Syntrophobacteraceae bacterium]
MEPDYMQGLVGIVKYGGNPEHKKNPGDFGLMPPSQPRADKSLCDVVGIFSKKEATRLLKEGVKKGLVSEQMRNGFPQNIWAVTENGCPLEAQLENAEVGIYHGYPMYETDPLCEEVLMRWKRS